MLSMPCSSLPTSRGGAQPVRAPASSTGRAVLTRPEPSLRCSCVVRRAADAAVLSMAAVPAGAPRHSNTQGSNG